MNHILDNPAWHALHSGNKHLAHGTDNVVYFDPAVSPFAAILKLTQENLEQLHQTIPFDNPIVLVSNEKVAIDKPWLLKLRMDGLQMVFDRPAEPIGNDIDVRTLTEEHVPQMLTLTKLTNPGPFASRTIDFGHYEGIFDGDRLVAMTGQRLHAYEYAEISAVCTHPDYLGKGYARHLIQRQLNRIQAASGTPFLHVRAGNDRAINVYETMGFETRTDIYFYFLQKM
jgi:ribosomal protein S18 acetylase RimI-like enzyme